VGNTQTVTIVFTDLVDSTATAERLGLHAADELRQMHFRLLRSAITGSGGSEVKNLGDGLMVTYSSPSRALAGAVGMQQAIEHYNQGAAEPLSVRIGVSSGEAIEEDGDYFGDPVVEAARLCSAASGGQILAVDIVRALVGRHATQTFSEIGPLKLKGIPTAVNVVEVLWEPVMVAGSIPLPGRLVAAATEGLFGFFGRSAELSVLEESRKRAHAIGRPHVVFVAGEAGMGKTMLVAQFARAAHGEGSVVLFGHSDEDLGIAYQPWIEALSPLVRRGDPVFVEGLRPAQKTALARLLPDVKAEGTRVADQDTERLLLLEAVTELLGAASTSSPVLLVLDDLHWADNSSLQLLRHVIASATEMDLTVACSYRDTDLGRGDALTKLLADLHREATVSRIALSGLEDIEIIELMTAAAGHELDADSVGLAHALRRETDGNPFFTAELLRHLAETGGIVVGDDGRWTVAGELDELGLPSSVRDVVGRRVQRLGEEALRILCLAAVIGREFDVRMLAALADMDEDLILDFVDTAVAASVLTERGEADRYGFSHALIQHTLYEELSPGRRQRAHQRIALALEAEARDDDPALVAELARHWIAATRPTDLNKAVSYARKAGDLAREALAPDDAIRWYRQALDLVERQTHPDDAQRASLLAALGTVQCQSGEPDFEDTLVSAAILAEQLDDYEVLVAAAFGFQVWHGMLVGSDKARRVLRAALGRTGPEPTPIRARLLLQLALSYDGSDWQTRRDLSTEAVDIAREAGDDATFVWVVPRLLSILGPDRFDQQMSDIGVALPIAERNGDPALCFGLGVARMWAAYQSAEIPQVDAVITDLQQLAETMGLANPLYQLATYEVGRQLLAGNVAEAEAANDRALELGTAAGEPQTLSAYGGLLVAIRQHQGRVEEIADLLISAARENPGTPALRSAIPSILCDLERFDEAREWFESDASEGFDYPYDAAWLAAMVNVTDTAAALGDRRACETLIERLAPFADKVVTAGVTVLLGALARPLGRAAGVLGRYDEAEAWFSVADDVHTRLQAPYWAARGQLDHADLCLARRRDGDLDRARELASIAAATAAEYGCALLQARAEGLLSNL
jgi:class 3 adenylate cyclase/tetratricopeptide (TPR) repeat protein